MRGNSQTGEIGIAAETRGKLITSFSRRRFHIRIAYIGGVCNVESDCAIGERCNHYCGCLNRQATGRIDLVSPVLCAHERIVLPIADELAGKLFKKRNSMFIQKHYNEMFPLISLVEDRTGAARAGSKANAD